MNEGLFLSRLQAYGADFSRWPQTERDAAEAFLLTAGHRLRDVYESERAFDLLLSTDTEMAPSPALQRRILQAVPAPRRRPMFVFPALGPRWAIGGVLGAALVLGAAVGYVGEPPAGSYSDYDQMLALTGSGSGGVFLAALSESEP
jgi:hypothetical protein